jgi:epoxyqueuosine reductase
MNILLHICCGVCAAGVVNTLTNEGHCVTGLFYNPNIYPKEEYFKRLEATQKVARELKFPLVALPFEPDEWISQTKSFTEEQEGGKRCPICFRLRLQQTFVYLQKSGADAFATTLSISPHKSAQVVNQIGKEIGGDKFLERDFKKKDGFKKTIQLARQWNLYQQNYCGCRYSLRSFSLSD